HRLGVDALEGAGRAGARALDLDHVRVEEVSHAGLAHRYAAGEHAPEPGEDRIAALEPVPPALAPGDLGQVPGRVLGPHLRLRRREVAAVEGLVVERGQGADLAVGQGFVGGSGHAGRLRVARVLRALDGWTGGRSRIAGPRATPHLRRPVRAVTNAG